MLVKPVSKNNNNTNNISQSLSVFGVFWSVFSHIRTEYGEDLLRKSPYSVWIQENVDQKNFEYG